MSADTDLISGTIEVVLGVLSLVAGCLFGLGRHPLYALVFGIIAAVFLASGLDALHRHLHPSPED